MKRLAVVTALFIATAASAQSWPTRPLRFIVPEAPSTPQDIISRGMVEPLGKALGQPVVVENRVGADGIIGNEACMRAPADGYTMCATASKDIIWNPVLRTKLPYDVLKDFAPIVHTGFFDSVLVVNPSAPVKRVSELFEYSKANPGKVNWGHFGVNSTGYMYMEWMNRNRGTAFYPVPYKTPITNQQGLMAGETSVAVTSISNSIGFIKGGKLRPLAVTMSKRLDALPDVPTFEEEGIKLPLRTWFGYHYQAGVPRELVTRMNAELHHVLDAPSFRAQILERQYVTPNTGTPEQFDTFIREQIRQVRELVAAIGIKPED
jgi:tripartite-type tricarboxylate transporter receptor subunit TctC